ncbi:MULTISPECIES: translation elongation factor Ts [Clostridiaceae]|uniref:Elongation factor Ts n=1 Tax=Clostridium facile TaxID=2763035 RepID=A0ABR7IP30_9CLOT|nr:MULTISPECIES: translation elongation factor Ts [Clostridiaceae]MBC5786886.1 elongation factor Ts [Clostridium facile]PWM98772.1 MAG: elongation factor Ts [Massilioclostridium sp.]
MASFTAKDVQALRQRTGVGMMDCKKALTEANGDTEKAIELLREKGLAAAAKKAGRIAAEGLVVSVIDPDKKVGAVVEVNAETDFVAKNKEFVAFVDAVAKTVLESNPADVEALNTTKLAGSDETVEEALREKILTIGENIKIRRFARLEGDLVSYVHGEGKIGVMVKFDTDVADKEGFAAYGKDVAMQIAAAAPQYLNKENVPAENLEKEKEILTVQAMNEGKPANIAEKMVAGRINKFYKEVCLVEQPFVKDSDMSVAQYTEKTAKELGGSIKIVDFVRFEKGEGIEKRNDNFADEVAGMIK